MLFPLVQMFHQDANLRRTCACSEPFCLDMQLLKLEGWKWLKMAWEWHLSQTWIMSFAKGKSIAARDFCRTCLGNWTYSCRGSSADIVSKQWVLLNYWNVTKNVGPIERKKGERERETFSDIPIIGRTFTNNFDKMLVQLISPKCQDRSVPGSFRQNLSWNENHCIIFFVGRLQSPTLLAKSS